MKVIHFNLQKNWRGGEQQLAYLIKSLEIKGVIQILICLENSALENFAIKENLNYIKIKKGWFNAIKFAYKLTKIIKKEKIDILHCHESKGHSIALYSKLFFNCKTPIILHRRVVFPIKSFLSKKIKYSSKYITKVICISRAVESVLKKSIKFKDTVIIHSMTDTKYNYVNHNILREKYKISGSKIIGYIAALTFEKDHYTFLNTAKKLLQSIPDLHFVIIGDGILRANLEKYSIENGLQNHVSFLGFIDNPKKVIPEIDLLLFTSTKEGLGSTILDFFVAKKPVVSVKNGGSEDLIQHGINGFICEEKDIDCLSKYALRILSDANVRTNIVKNAFEFVENNFSIEIVTTKTYDCYKSILGKEH